jgi:hypothetical protein
MPAMPGVMPLFDAVLEGLETLAITARVVEFYLAAWDYEI